MSAYSDIIQRYFEPTLSGVKQDIKNRRDKEFFRETGTQIYVGKQGSGKTASAVYHALKLKKKYPKMIIVTNIQLFVNFEYVTFSSAQELANKLTSVNNGKHGVLFLIDEIHTYFNALDSMNIPPYVFTEISQQRKQRKAIVGTSQLFLRVAKPLREQVDTVIYCKTKFGVLTKQIALDGASIEQDRDGKIFGDVKARGLFIQSAEFRAMYDTYQKVVSSEQQMYEYFDSTETKKRRIR